MKIGLAFLVLVSLPLGMVVMAKNHSADEELVRRLDDQERIATLNRDLPAIDRLWSEELTVNAPNNRVVVGKRAVLDTFVQSGIINFRSSNAASSISVPTGRTCSSWDSRR